MRIDPYRTPPASAPSAPELSTPTRFEERCVGTVLVAAGALGLAIGLHTPEAHAAELVLGTLFVALGLCTFRPPRARTEDRSRPPR